MRQEDLDALVASTNPIDEHAVHGAVPPSVGEAMLREITTVDRPSLVTRLADALTLQPRSLGRAGFVGVVALVAVAVLALNLTALGGLGGDGSVDPAALPADAPDCAASGASLAEARQAYNQNCTDPRMDCDPLDGGWTCSNRQIGDDKPGGPDVTIRVTSTTSPPTVDPPTTGATSPSTTSPSTPTTAVISPVGACTASGASLAEATANYASTCTEPRSDCDPVNGAWLCSSEEIGGGTPSAPRPGSSTTSPANPPATVAPVGGGRCISLEAESLRLVGDWNERSDSQASGGSYIVWEGLSRERNNGSPDDIIRTSINITQPGTYRFAWLMRQESGVAGDKANDSWLNFPDAARFGPTGGGSYGGFVKVFGNARDSFRWAGTADQSHAKSQIAIQFPRAGSYTMELAGRSHGHQIDRILLHHDSVSRSDAIAGRCGGGGNPAPPTPAPAPTPTPTTNPPTPTTQALNPGGPFDSARDLISLHYDHAPDRDDGHATVAGRVVTQSLGITPWVVGGAYGKNRNTYVPASEVVMDATWGSAWVNADADWPRAVTRTADRWQQTLNGGGDIWVAEGGQSDFTADVVRELRQRNPSLDTNNRIHTIQHSRWNEDQTTDSDLAYTRANTDYVKIEDGNANNRTADLNQVTNGWPQRARNSQWGSAWDAAFNYLNPSNRLDFSDTVELLHILGIGKSEIANPNDFADRFFR